MGDKSSKIYLEVNFTIHVIYTKNVHVIYHLCIAVGSGGFRGGVRGVRPPKIRKANVIQH